MINMIEIKNLKKSFKVITKEPGLRGYINAIIRPKHKIVNAVNGISMTIKKGELVAFIGPNGAGKSTTLKMLSGILYPDSGTIKIDGLNPQKDRIKLAYRMGTIFGQKPQLWYHLPAIDTFYLFSKIYDMDPEIYKKRLEYLIEKFDIKEFMDQPVRKLSLGQRMRCEFVLALLHKPQILFLDEPTIGLDIVVKKNIREIIKKINKEEKVTILLTSHDVGDIEDVANRVVIINRGIIVYNGTFSNLRKEYLNKKKIKIISETPVVFNNHSATKIINQSKYSLDLEVDLTKTSLKEIIDIIMKNNKIEDISIEDPEIEEIIEDIYNGKEMKITRCG